MEYVIEIIFILVVLYFTVVVPKAKENEKKMKQEVAANWAKKYETGEISASQYIAVASVLGAESRAEQEKLEQKKQTGQIIKGAVVGGIVAGDAGAVVGAVAAKNKIDNQKK